LGEHNKENIRAAVAVAKEFGISDQAIKSAIEKFKPLAHRLEFIGEFKGIKFYDDANATTPEAAILAIKTLKKVDTIFLGGQDRGYDFSQLEKTIKKYKIKNVVLFPESGKRIKVKGLNVLRTKSMYSAVKFAYKNTEKRKICLLSCASPSYSLWKNFEEKGSQFQKAVRKYSK
jgi:UDP-N-acetylmuramoylalanine--D-glutamate ligase